MGGWVCRVSAVCPRWLVPQFSPVNGHFRRRGCVHLFVPRHYIATCLFWSNICLITDALFSSSTSFSSFSTRQCALLLYGFLCGKTTTRAQSPTETWTIFEVPLSSLCDGGPRCGLNVCSMGVAVFSFFLPPHHWPLLFEPGTMASSFCCIECL